MDTIVHQLVAHTHFHSHMYIFDPEKVILMEKVVRGACLCTFPFLKEANG